MTQQRRETSERQARNAFIAMIHATDGIVADDSRIMSTYGLTPSQFSALVALAKRGPLCQKTLGENMLKSDGNVTMVVRNLEKRGMVTRSRDQKDARYITVAITAEGQALYELAHPPVERSMLDIMGSLSGDELKALQGVCLKLSRSLQERKADTQTNDQELTNR